MSDWKTYSLEQLADIRISNVDKKLKPNENSVRLCNYMDVYANDYITNDLAFMESTANSVERAKFKVDRGDILITKDSETPYDIGIPSVVLDDVENLVCGYHLALIKPNKDVSNPLFLSKYLAASSVSSYFSRVAAGSTRYGLSNGAIARTKIKLPSLKKQHKISTVLLTIDRTIAKTEALIEKYQQIKAGLMHDLFTRGIGADGKLRSPREEAPELYQESAIGWIPKEWEVKPLVELTSKIVDGVHHTPKYVEHGVPFVTVKNLTGSATINFDNLNYIDEKTHYQCYARANPKPGDVLVTKDGTLGVCRIVRDGMPEFSIFVSVALLRVESKLTPEWLHFFFDSGVYLKQLGHLSSGTGLKHIHLEHFRKFKIALPSTLEQKRINKKVKITEDKIMSEKKTLSKLFTEKSGLMHDLLTGKVFVNIDSAEVAHK